MCLVGILSSALYRCRTCTLCDRVNILNDLFLDKICDQVSDAVLDACLEQDRFSKVACGMCKALLCKEFVYKDIPRMQLSDYVTSKHILIGVQLEREHFAH